MSARHLVLVHGAGSGPWIFEGWRRDLPSWSLHAVDLHDGLEVARASMDDYRAAVMATMKGLVGPVALCGWSMGGLVAMMAATDKPPDAMVLLEPSPPAEVQGFDHGVTLGLGTFLPEPVYGEFPDAMPSRPESELARSERKRGISIPRLTAPTLVVAGDEFRVERGETIAARYGTEFAYLAGFSHWDLVLQPSLRRVVERFLAAAPLPANKSIEGGAAPD